MADPNPYQNWLEDYQRQVNDELAKPAESSAIHRVVADFENWWQSEQGSVDEEGEVSFAAHTINEELKLSRKEVGMLKEEIERLKVTPGGQIHKALQERLRTIAEERNRLDETQKRLEEIESGLESAVKTKHSLEREKDDLEEKIKALAAKLNDKDTAQEAVKAQLSEARRCAAELQERLIRSGEAALDTLDSSANVLGEGRRRRRGAEDRIAETTQFLEMKIREIRDENKERFGQFRELLDALSRFRYHKGQP